MSARWINGFNLTQYFDIRGRDLDKFREEIRGTPYLKVPEKKKTKPTAPFWYDLDYVATKFRQLMKVPDHLVYNE